VVLFIVFSVSVTMYMDSIGEIFLTGSSVDLFVKKRANERMKFIKVTKP
jgi:hypothetical protein